MSSYTPAPRPRPTPRRRDPALFLVGAVTGILLSLLFALSWPSSEDPDLLRYRQVRDWVESSYVEEVSADALIDDALRGLVGGLDEYSRYYGRDQIEALERETHGRYVGIGAVFRQPTSRGQVLFTLPDSPAERAGLLVGDRILEIDGEPIEDLEPGGLRERLTREENSIVELLVAGLDDRRRSIEVRLDYLVDPSIRHVRMLDRKLGLGYAAIHSFSDETPQEFDEAVRALQEEGLRALVVDVRGNHGGVLLSSIALANRFVSKGLIASTEGRGEPVVYEARSGAASLEGLALVVLVDGQAASASEVFAAALQDHRAAVLLGSPTWGKGMVQRMRTFGERDAVVKLSTSYYYTPSHRNLERTVDKAWEHGIEPDVWVPLSQSETERIHDHLAGYSPPEGALAELRAWEDAQGLELIARHPPDRQLDEALELLRGRPPGPGLARGDG